jgi:transposase InsO family protein
MCIGFVEKLEDGHLNALEDCTGWIPESNTTAKLNIKSMLASNLSMGEEEKISAVIRQFSDAFQTDLEDKPNSKLTTKHRINTGDHLPISQRPYRVSPVERRTIQEEVDKMLKRDIIQPSESPWSSPVVLVKKKDGSWRFCVDYRKLNSISKKDVYPLPRIDDTLDCLKGARYFSSMDLFSGYWQIEVDEADREKTAFVTPEGLYQFKYMPFGLCNAPATFERMMDNLLRHLKWKMCLCYLDDIIVFSTDFEEHLSRLTAVFQCIQSAGLRLNPKKCLFAAPEIKVLGHLVNEDGVRPDPEKVRAITHFPLPQNIKDIKSFLGLCSYYRRFIKDFCNKSQPLQQLLKGDATFVWKEDQQRSFDVLKHALTSDPVLGLYDENAETELHTDASGYGLGAVLVQMQKGNEKVIAYASRVLSKAEKNYSTTEKECLAAVWGITKFRPYLFGRPFNIVTDHHSLCWLANLKDPSGRLARWALRLQEHDVTITYKSGHKHRDADCLSRNPVPDRTNDIPSVSAVADIAAEQRDDPELLQVIESLENGVSVKQGYHLMEGVLCKKNYDPLEQPWLPVVPKHLRDDILKFYHDAPISGHLGFAKTFDRVRRKFYWPRLYRTVRRYVKHCRDCQRRKHVPQLPPGQLVPIPPAISPFHRIGIDLLGRFPITTLGKKWIIVCTDYLTRYAITKALPTADASEVAKFLVEEVILKHGAPRAMISDRGKVFQSKLVAEIISLCQVNHKMTTAYHPQTNGLTERFNKTLADMLSMYVDIDHKDWDSFLPFVTFAYNTAKQDTTGFTPFFLLHGREAETTMDTMFPFYPDDSYDDYVDHLLTKAEEARQLARTRTLIAQDREQERYNTKHRPVTYRPGELVWVFTPVRKVGLSEKLLRRYFGPYKVLRRLSAVNYEVEDFDPDSRRRRRRDVVHVLRMKPYNDPDCQREEVNSEFPVDPDANLQDRENEPPADEPKIDTEPTYHGPLTRARKRAIAETAGR